MDIIVRNPPASGANLSDNTNQSILSYAKFIEEHGKISAPFSQFRKDVAAEMGTNIKNDRTIYPMLRYLGLISYNKQEDLYYPDFFTKTGTLYVKMLRLKMQVKDALEKRADDTKLMVGLSKFDMALHEIIFHGLQYMFTHYTDDEVKYRPYLIALIKFLLQFNSIDKKEFALLTYAFDNEMKLDELDKKIRDYRNGNLEINILVDAYDKKQGGSVRKKASDSNLTAYSYHISLLAGAGIIEKKQNARYYLVSENRENIASVIKQLEQTNGTEI